MTFFNPPAQTGSATPANILVVDDAEASRYLVGSWLRRGGYRVTEAATGGEALALLDQQPVDLVLLDVNLPDMSGFDVCETVKNDPRTAAVPVIHVSATAIEPEDRTLGLTRGADAYLVEPVDPGELVATVEAALRYYRARSVAERLAERLAQLTKVTLAVNTVSTFDGLLTAAASGTAAMFAGPATVLTLTDRGTVRSATTELTDLPVTLTTESSDVIIPSAASVPHDVQGPQIAIVDNLGWHPSASAALFVARPKPSQTPVCVAVDSAAVATEEDRNLLLQLGQAVALACEGLRSFSAEHTLALTLQRSLLPRRLPEHPRLSMAARYVPASQNAEIGGDFYEVTELDGRLLIAVGDVTGHSIEAATVMGEVRHALRAYAVEGHGPVEVLERLDLMLQRFHPSGLTTVCLMYVDRDAETVEVANAGHIPPLMADEHGARYLDVSGPLLGVGLPRPPATRLALPPDTLVLLVTDGLIEKRGRSMDDGMNELLGSVSHQDKLENLCDMLLDRFGQDAKDDIALLAFRRR